MVVHALLPAVGLAAKVPAHSTLVSASISMPIMSQPPPLMGGALVPAPGASIAQAAPPLLRHEWATPSMSVSITSPTGKQDIRRACNELARLREYACHVRHDDRACRDVAKIMRSLGCDSSTNIKPRLNLSFKLH